jgi:hypothetical protein
MKGAAFSTKPGVHESKALVQPTRNREAVLGTT